MKEKKKIQQYKEIQTTQAGDSTHIRHLPFLIAALILLFALQSAWHAYSKSNTYDEIGHLTVSYLLWKTEHSGYDVGHPHLIRYLLGIPLAMMNPSLPSQMELPEVPDDYPVHKLPRSSLYFYSALFLFQNRLPAETLIFWPRMINVVLGCILGFVIFKFSSKLYGTSAGILSLFLAALCPNLIAHSSLVTTDIGGAVSAVAFLYSFVLLVEKRSAKRILAAGFLLGIAMISKMTNIFLVPLFIVTYSICVGFFIEKAPVQKGQLTKTPWIEIAKTILVVLVISWFVLCAGYGFEKIFALHILPQEDWNNLGFGKIFQTLYSYSPFPNSFLRGLLYNVYHDRRGHASFLLGEYSNYGWRHYFPVAFLIKTPTATLLLIFSYFVFIVRKKIKLSKNEFILLLPIFFLVGTSIMSKINIGLRHILLCYPLLYILLGRMVCAVNFQSVKMKFFAGLIAMALTGEVFSVSPHYLAFFNRLSGGPEKGIEYLSDSNIDWGQDLNNLGAFLKKEGNPEIVLSYFGTAVPEYYGIRYQSLPAVWSFPKSEHVNSAQPAKEYLAISVTSLQGTYSSVHDLYSWLKRKNTIAKIGHSIYVYDITSDREIHQKLMDIYRMTGEVHKFMRESTRVRMLSGVP